MKALYRSPMVFGVILAAVVAVYSASRSVGQPARPNAAVRWEYKELQLNLFSTASLNDAGAEGWELVSAAFLKEGSGVLYVFKRPRQP